MARWWLFNWKRPEGTGGVSEAKVKQLIAEATQEFITEDKTNELINNATQDLITSEQASRLIDDKIVWRQFKYYTLDNIGNLYYVVDDELLSIMRKSLCISLWGRMYEMPFPNWGVGVVFDSGAEYVLQISLTNEPDNRLQILVQGNKPRVDANIVVYVR